MGNQLVLFFHDNLDSRKYANILPVVVLKRSSFFFGIFTVIPFFRSLKKILDSQNLLISSRCNFSEPIGVSNSVEKLPSGFVLRAMVTDYFIYVKVIFVRCFTVGNHNKMFPHLISYSS